ncbi:MAG TPA: TonB-dependent receptor [Terriglobia bacterium]|nr:TonB-dependent receptor [Terriglobia bacterium]
MTHKKHIMGALIALLAVFVLSAPLPLRAQLATATINGTVTDPSGAVVPQATVMLQNVATGVKQSRTTNSVGDYVITGILPGSYTIEVSKTGFKTTQQKEFTLYVNQTATFNITLPVGQTTQTVSVQAAGIHLEASTAELGTAITTTQVNNLPLNGRNFTELLELTPGVSRATSGQSAGGGGGFVGNAIGTFTFPSINGQKDRSNFFLLDGLNDQNSFISEYNVSPIVDQIEEFKVESHNDSAEFGGVAGGIINVVTKSGTNDFHGSAWEFLRNNAFDARNPFLSTVTPFHQNQFGAAVGGPVIIPRLYNGKNRTFFYAAYEGYRNHTPNTSFFTTPTPAELNGDFSALLNRATPVQIYNPFSAVPNGSGGVTVQPFLNNQIPQNLINKGMQLYGKTLFPAPVTTSLSNLGINGIDNTPNLTRQDTASLRFDHQFNQSNTTWIRYSGYTQPDLHPAGIPGVVNPIFIHGYQAGANYTHVFSNSLVGTFEFGRSSGQDNTIIQYQHAAASLWQQVGFSPNYAAGFAGGGPFNPGIGINGYLSFGTGNMVQDTHFANTYEFRGDMVSAHGSHTFKWGADFQSNNTQSPIYGVSDSFSSFNTSLPGSTAVTGDAAASFLLGVPNSAGRRNVDETEHGGWVDGAYFMDTWKASDKLTLNLGLRYDVTLVPIYGSLADKNQYVGDLDLNNGTFVLARVPPACGNGVGAPCIPGGTLPANVVATPNSNHSIIQNTFDNWQPRIGLAYRLFPRTVIRGSFGRFYDNWGGIMQIAQNYEGSWPDIGQLLAQNLNTLTTTAPTPTATAQDPFNLGTTQPLPAATPFGTVQWYMNPKFQDAYSNEWNFGVQQQIGTNTVVTANYVGSLTKRADQGGMHNIGVPSTNGAAPAPAPYPYIAPTFYDNSDGASNYNAFQFSLNGRHGQGLTYLVSYTWSKTMNYGCDGWYGNECQVQNPYDRKASYSVAGYDLPQIFSVSSVYQLPFGSGKRFQTGNKPLDHIIGNWQINGIATLTSGTPYNINASGNIAGTGNNVEFADLVGSPNLSNSTPTEWINKAAFQVPAQYTLGTYPRNFLRSNWYKDFDLSIFRDFTITESKRLEFRAEFFNGFNNVVWRTPDTTITDLTFGAVTGVANTPRQIQFGLKFIF